MLVLAHGLAPPPSLAGPIRLAIPNARHVPSATSRNAGPPESPLHAPCSGVPTTYSRPCACDFCIVVDTHRLRPFPVSPSATSPKPTNVASIPDSASVDASQASIGGTIGTEPASPASTQNPM